VGGIGRRLDKLERETEEFYEVLTLEDGTTVKYESGEKLEVLFALLDRREHRLLPYLWAMDTNQGMPGLVRALEGGTDGA
jgi:ribosome biogenesis protein Tsr3